MPQLLQQAARLVISCYSIAALVQQVEQGTASQLAHRSFAGDGCQQLQRSQRRLAVVPQGLQACTYVKTEAADSLHAWCSSLKQSGHVFRYSDGTSTRQTCHCAQPSESKCYDADDDEPAQGFFSI